DIARVNITERVVARAEARRTPLSVLGGVVRLAGLSAYGLFAFLVSILGYLSALAFLITALIKPFAWDHAGLWITRNAPDDVIASSTAQNSGSSAMEVAWPASWRERFLNPAMTSQSAVSRSAANAACKKMTPASSLERTHAQVSSGLPWLSSTPPAATDPPGR